MSIPTPPDLSVGRVSWTVGRGSSRALSAGRGVVRFRASAVAVNFSTVTVLPDPVETPVLAGVMTPVDLIQNDPEVWNWVVEPSLGVPWEPFHIDVDGPVDLATAAVTPGKGPIRAVKGEKGDTPTWGDLPGKPTTFPPASHQHPVSDVTGLAARLAALEYDSGSRDVPLLTGTGGELRLRRVGRLVEMALVNYRPVVGDQRLYQLPVGFRPSATVVAVASDNGTFRSGAIFSYAPFAVEIRAVPTAGTWINMQATWTTGDPIPTTLPGDPA